GTRIPPKAREQQLQQFLDEHNVKPEGEQEFMERVVAPWANQAAIESLMADDYERMNRDEDVVDAGKSSFRSNDFGAKRDGPREDLKKVGEQVDAKVGEGVAADEILDFLIGSVPELKGRYAKLSAVSE
ncbi:hypothetical protein, partial [Paraburkholderia sp. BR14312]|uniref:hypothetical protein n=1 Tax=Paraburkholderia sp. BR14312 TaxID=3237003 RepID=UPI0034CF9AAD